MCLSYIPEGLIKYFHLWCLVCRNTSLVFSNEDIYVDITFRKYFFFQEYNDVYYVSTVLCAIQA